VEQVTDRSKRVLWLLQHKTLMQAEVPILLRLGYEVFVPKVIPERLPMRSSIVTHEYDGSLTIPADVLERLNATDFYTEGAISDQVNADMNEYFGAAFFIVYDGLHINMLRNFRGALLHRAFGHVEHERYYRVLQWLGRGGAELITAAKDRFWFAESYDNLALVEPPLFSNQAAYLPLALSETFIEEHTDTWTGGDRNILLVAPDINMDANSRRPYDRFKALYGDLPHTIAGRQHVPVDDPHVIGFVSDDELMELTRRSAVMVSVSREPRHVYYSPIEAAIVGLPVVFYRNSLLGSLLPEGTTAGSAIDDASARALVERLLDGDADEIARIRSEQHAITEKFSEAWCEAVWAENLERLGINELMRTPPRPEDDLRDLDPTDPANFVPPELRFRPEDMSAGPVLPRVATVDFREVDLSPDVYGTSMLDAPEEWGAWVRGRTVHLRLTRPVSGWVDVWVRGGAISENFGRPLSVRFGSARGSLELNTWVKTPSLIRLTLRLPEPADVLTLTAQESVTDVIDRELAFGLTELWVEQSTPAAGAAAAARQAALRTARRVGRRMPSGLRRAAKRVLGRS
jgi:hypothetical protein